ncbi:hypothetical protein BS47DRAFT_1481277 [Hydnum rufescens UP504]|uniref:Uncharacterized protein n=1 Tax=Hydnum rufescens UP504 TaxID=1448309 RepID=A0A9P6DZG5_9AGAM|nr:hypothetical protein BS47DRAFT_1481277 [Hydnum rufescens UP504]
MEMNEAERIAYEMRGGETGTMYGEDGDGDDLGDEDLSDGQRQQVHQQPTPVPSVASQAARPTRLPQHQSGQPPVIDTQHPQSMVSPQYHVNTQPAQHQLIPQQQIGFPGSFIPPTFDAIAAAAAGFPSAAPLVEADAAKFAAWNAHFYSALAAQQHPATGLSAATTMGRCYAIPDPIKYLSWCSGDRAPNTSNVFAAGMKGMEDSNAPLSSPSTQSFSSSTFGNDGPPSSSARASTIPNTSTSSMPSLALSGVSSAGSSSSAVASPIPFNLGSDPFGTGVNFSYGSASAGPNWTTADSRSTSSTPGLSGLSHHPQAVSVGGGGGGSHTSYAMMSMFI